MKYSEEERLEIGRRIYVGELSKYEASEEYSISETSARDYMRLYRDKNNLPPKNRKRLTASNPSAKSPETMEDIEAMTREELIDALIMARINEARLKKGYMVKGVGANKQFILLGKKNTK